MVDAINSSRTGALAQSQNSSTVSRTSQRAAQALLDQVQKAKTVVSVTSTPLATSSSSSKPPAKLPRGSLVDILA